MGKAKASKRGGAHSAANNGFKFNKDFGQHILKNPGIAEAIVDKANLKPTDTVLEVGPGTGNLTVKILEKARNVIAVEMDPRMAAETTKRVQGTPQQKRLDMILGDVIKTTLPKFDVCISNTPYQISSPLTFKLLSMPNPPRTCILMFQREFAMRLNCSPGRFSLLSSIRKCAILEISHVLKVGRANFRPPPQVDSSVVRIEPKIGKERPNIAFEEWDGMLRICFNRRNKTLRASFLGNKEVLSIIEKNYRLFCSQNNIAVDESIVDVDDDAEDMEVDEYAAPSAGDDDDEWGGIMDVDGAADNAPSFFEELKAANSQMPKTKSKRSKSGVALLVREKVRRVLEDVTGLADQRSGKCDENDFLRLLAAFNAENIHFS